jgi:hypothetical protein
LRKAFNEDSSLARARDTDGSTFLHWGALRGDLSIVDACLAADAEVRASGVRSARRGACEEHRARRRARRAVPAPTR